MTEQQMEKMGFREWTDHYEKEQEQQREQIGELTKNVSSLSADVRTLVENQRGMFSRLNRPQAPLMVASFAVLISLAGLFATFITLTVNPIKDSVTHIEDTLLLDDSRDLQLHIMLKEDIEAGQEELARQSEALRWLEKMEERDYQEMKGIYTRVGNCEQDHTEMPCK